MEGEKEKQRQQREEKESNEAEDDTRSDDSANNDEEDDDEGSEVAALVWQEDYGEENLSFPIMHWQALSLRIAELEKQEEEKKEKKTKSGASLERGRVPLSSREERGRRTEAWEDGDDACNSHVLALTSRLQTQMNLQLCFINNSESEEEEEVEKEGEISKKEGSSTRRGAVQVQKNFKPAVKLEKPKFHGFRNTLRNLRDRLRTDSKSLTLACGDRVVQRRHFEQSDLLSFSMKDLNALSISLSQAIQDLSSELVDSLQVRDQLKTKQDAMLLEVQDLSSL